MNLSAFSVYSTLFGHMTPQEIVHMYKENNYNYAVISDIYMITGIDEFIKVCKQNNIKPIIGITIKLKYKNTNSIYIGNVTILFQTYNGYLKFIQKYNKIILQNNQNNYEFEYDSFQQINDIIIIIGNKGSILSSILEQTNKEDKIYYEFIKKINEIYKKQIYFGYSNIQNTEEIKLKEYLLQQIISIPQLQLVPTYPIIHKYNNDKDTDSLYKHITLIAIDKKTQFEKIIIQNQKNQLQTIKYYEQEYALIQKKIFYQIYNDSNYQNIEKIIQKCNFHLQLTEIIKANDFVHNIYDASQIIQKITKEKLKEILKNIKCQNKKQQYIQRYNEEIYMYNKIKIYNILYIVYDFIKWAENNEVHIGPGRGSCVGSLIIYLLNITKVDPIQHDLLFERFINEDRYTIADIDIDVCNETRQKLLEYLDNKYSNNHNNINVIHIIVFLRFMEKSSFKDVMRATNTSLNFNEVNNFMKESEKIFNDNKTITQKLEQIIENHCIHQEKLCKLLKSLETKTIINFVKEIKQHNEKNNIYNIYSTNLYDYIQNITSKLSKILYFNEFIKQIQNEIPKIEIIDFIKLQNQEKTIENIKNILKYISKKLNNFKQAIHNSKKFKNCIRGTGVHAGGILITEKSYNHYLPIHISNDSKKTILTTQFDLDTLNKNNIFKFDLLGLETITIIHTTLKKIYQIIKDQKENNNKIYQYINNQKHHEIFIKNNTIDINKIINNVVHDKEKYKSVYQIIKNGYHRNIFQLDRQSTANIANKMLFDRFDDIVALTSIIRPGASELIEEYIQNKKNFYFWSIENQNNPDFEIVKSTFGILAFQEQITKIAISIANFTPKEADMFRYAIGKKKIEFIKKYKEKFFNGCKNQNIPIHKVEELYDRIEKFASYAFNKSHAVAYSYISLQTMYLKTFHPFLFALTCINLKIKEKNKTRAICMELIMMFKDIYFIYPEIHKNHIEFTHQQKNSIHYIFVSLLSINGITKQFTKYLIDHDDYNTNTIKTILQKSKPNKKIIQSIYALYVFRKHEIEIKEILNNITQQKYKDNQLTSETIFEKYIIKKEKKQHKTQIHKKLFQKENLKLLIQQEYIYYEISYIKLNIASIIKKIIQKDSKKINSIYFITDKTNYHITLTNINLPFIYFKILQTNLENSEICDVVLKIKNEETLKSTYFNLTQNIIENNCFKLEQKYIENYFQQNFYFGNQKYNIKDKFWYLLLLKIDKQEM